MLDLLGHLIPDFRHLYTGGSDALTAWFVTFQIGIGVITLGYVGWRSSSFNNNLKGIESLIHGQTADSIALHRTDVQQKARQSNNPIVRSAWSEFDKSLVPSVDREALYSTLDAAYFFNAHTLAPQLTQNRLLANMPSILVAIGVLGTFVGLTIGLGGLSGTTGEIEALKDGINSLISGAVIAFSSSVWGVLLSIILGLLLRLAEGRAHKAIHALQGRIDSLYKRQPPEASLIHIANDAQQSKSALQELHERIGNRLQESVQSLSTGLQEALTTTLEKVMGPAINSLVDSSRQQSSQVLETLLNDFMSGMNAVGSAQAQRMNEAAASVDTAINGLADNMQQMFARLEAQQRERLRIEQENGERYQLQLRQVTEAAVARENQLEQKFSGLLNNLSTQISQQLGGIDALERERNQRHAQQAEELHARQQEMLAGIASAVQSTQTQSMQMAGQHQTLLSDLQKASIASAQSSQHMDSLAGQLGDLSSNLHATIELFSKHLTETARNIQSAITENNRLAGHIGQQVALMQQLQQTLLNSAALFEQGARQAHEGFDAMKQHQQSFLNDVRQQFNMLGLNLQEQVRGIEAQAKQWLEDYGKAVREQTQDRMSEWNKQTSQFSNDMLRSVQSMSTLLDELERKLDNLGHKR